jgi:hypothetical protein
MINWRKIESGDYPLLVQWWKDWGWEAYPSPQMLPSSGYMVYEEESGIPLYVGFIYYTGTVMAWVEYIVSNKDAKPEQKRGALEYLLNVISTIAKENGIEVLFTSTANDAFVNSLKKCRFDATEKNTQLIKNL